MAIDLSPILTQFLPSQIIPTILIVVAALAACYAWLRAMGWTLAAIRGDLSASDKQRAFQLRYKRESRNREYREWKKSKGFL